MLTTLKAKMRTDVEFKTSLESSLDVINENDTDVKDIFLDDPDAIVIGAENDPEIEKLVDSLPDDVNTEVNEITDEEVEDLIENFVPMSTVMEDVSRSSEDNDPGDSDADDQKVTDESKTDVGEDQEDIEDAPDKAPVKESVEDDEEEEVSDDDLDVDLSDIDESFFEVFAEGCDILLGKKQEEAEDADDKAPVAGEPNTDNIDGEKQDDIEDAPDKAPVKESVEDFDDDFEVARYIEIN